MWCCQLQGDPLHWQPRRDELVVHVGVDVVLLPAAATSEDVVQHPAAETAVVLVRSTNLSLRSVLGSPKL